MCLSVPAQVLKIENGNTPFPTGKVSFGGVIKEVSLVYLPEAQVGDYVLIHVGFAISLIDAEKAQEVFKTLQELKIHFEIEDQSP